MTPHPHPADRLLPKATRRLRTPRTDAVRTASLPIRLLGEIWRNRFEGIAIVAVIALLYALFNPTPARSATYTVTGSDFSTGNGWVYTATSNGGSGGWSTSPAGCNASGAHNSGSYCQARWNAGTGLAFAGAGNVNLNVNMARDESNYEHGCVFGGGIFNLWAGWSGPGGNFNVAPPIHCNLGAGSHTEAQLFRFSFSGSANVTAGGNRFTLTNYNASVIDFSNPVAGAHTINTAAVNGYRGPGGASITYNWSDVGSQMESVSITNTTTNTSVDSWSAATAAARLRSAHPSVTRTITLPAPGTGTYSFRSRGVDRAGGATTHEFTVSFDTTPPSIGAPALAGEPLDTPAVVRGSATYRPSIRWTYADTHSGMSGGAAAVSATIAGTPVPVSAASGVATLAPSADLPLGSHTLQLRVVDAVGNVATRNHTVNVVDDVAPTFTVAEPAATGDNNPNLDITAADDRSGIDASSWTVRVNGQLVVSSSSTSRLQANLGTLANGKHRITVTVADGAGNVGTHEFDYVADSGDGTPALPDNFGSGIWVYSAPTSANHGDVVRIAAVFVQHGRPVSGRAELRYGTETAAGKEISPYGAADIQLTVDRPGPVTVHGPAGAGLIPVEVAYGYSPPAGDGTEVCDKTPDHPSCNTGGSGTGGTGNGGNTGGGAYTGTPKPGTCDGPWPCNIIYVIGNIQYWNGLPIDESGQKGIDKVAPTWRVTFKPTSRAFIVKKARINVTLHTSELSVVRSQVKGSAARTTASARKQPRTIGIHLGKRSPAYKQLVKLRPGHKLNVAIRVRATDKAGNRTTFRYMKLTLQRKGKNIVAAPRVLTNRKAVDKKAPKWTLKIAPQSKVALRKTKRIAVDLWANEQAVLRVQVRGTKAQTIALPGRKTKRVALLLNPKSAVYKQLAGARAGSTVKLPVRVQATDKAGNKTKAKWQTVKVTM